MAFLSLCDSIHSHHDFLDCTVPHGSRHQGRPVSSWWLLTLPGSPVTLWGGSTSLLYKEREGHFNSPEVEHARLSHHLTDTSPQSPQVLQMPEFQATARCLITETPNTMEKSSLPLRNNSNRIGGVQGVEIYAEFPTLGNDRGSPFVVFVVLLVDK